MFNAPCWPQWVPPVSFKHVAYGGTTFVAVGDEGTIITSPDGLSWTERSTDTFDTLNSVAFGGGFFVTVGGNGALLTSPDGTVWRSRNIGVQSSSLNSVTYGDGTFVAVGNGGLIIQSGNLLNPWIQIESITMAPDGSVRLVTRSPVNSVLSVDFSQDLSDWTPLKTVTNSLGSLEISDPSARDFPQRYFRVKLIGP